MATVTPKDYYDSRPLPSIREVDAAFIREISYSLNEDCGLSLDIDAKKIINKIRKVCRYCYDNYQFKSLEHAVVVIRRQDLMNSRQGNGGLSSHVYLPNSIMGMDSIKFVNGGNYSLSSRILDIPLLSASSFASSSGNFGVEVNNSRYNNYAVSDATIALYEHSSYTDKFKSGIPFNFNSSSKKFTVFRDVPHDIALRVQYKTDPSNLYDDYYFREHVMGECMIGAARIFGTFDLKLAGDATINWQEIKSDGKEKVQEAKEYYKTTNANSRTYWK